MCFHVQYFAWLGHFSKVCVLLCVGLELWFLEASSAPCRPELRLTWIFPFWSVKIVRRCLIHHWCFHLAYSKMARYHPINPLTLFCSFYLSCSFPLTPTFSLLLPRFPPHSISLFFAFLICHTFEFYLTWHFHFLSSFSLSFRKTERKMGILKQQKEDCVLKEEKTRHYLEAVIPVAEHISRERDQLLHMVITTL